MLEILSTRQHGDHALGPVDTDDLVANLSPVDCLFRPVIGADGAKQDRIEFVLRKRLVIVGKIAVQIDIRFVSRSEEHTSELQSLMRISYAVFCLKTKKHTPQ